MKTTTPTVQRCLLALAAIAASIVVAGCHHPNETAKAAPSGPAPVAAPKPPAPPEPPAAPVAAGGVIRIKAGVGEPFKDSAGNVWLPDQGFEGGEPIERPDLQIANTKDPGIYRAERYSMTSFTRKLPNGKYTVKLHFAETFEGITGPGQRVFSFIVQGHEFKDFDVWAKSGGFCKAYVEPVNVEVTDGQLVIKFISNIENPQICGIEIIPAS
jgi:hypothetical protein